MSPLQLHTSATIDIFSASSESELELPVISGGISAGFPSLAIDFIDLTINLNKHVLKHPSSTFYGRVKGESRQHAKRLRSLNVKTAFDFIQLSDAWVQRNMSIVGLRLKKYLQGIPTLDLVEAQAKKNIATIRTFETNYTEFSQIIAKVLTLVYKLIGNCHPYS